MKQSAPRPEPQSSSLGLRVVIGQNSWNKVGFEGGCLAAAAAASVSGLGCGTESELVCGAGADAAAASGFFSFSPFFLGFTAARGPRTFRWELQNSVRQVIRRCKATADTVSLHQKGFNLLHFIAFVVRKVKQLHNQKEINTHTLIFPVFLPVSQQLGGNQCIYSVGPCVKKPFEVEASDVEVTDCVETKEFTNLLPYVRWTPALCATLPWRWLQEAPEGTAARL